MPLYPNVTTLASQVSVLEGLVANGGTLDVRVDDIEALVLNGGTLDLRVDALDALCLNGGTLDVRVDTLEVHKETNFGYAEAGDQISLATTNKTPFVKVGSVLASAAAVDDQCEWGCLVWVDGVDGGPAFTVKFELGTAELDSQVIAVAAANDYVLIKGHGKITAATTMLMYKGEGRTKDAGSLAEQTRAAPAAVTIQSLGTARALTASVTSDTGHASNLCTIKDMWFKVHKTVVPA